MKKIIILAIISILAVFGMTGCDDNGVIPDPGNGNGDNPSVEKNTVLVEAYVAVGCGYCATIEPFLENLAMEYSRDEMILVELAPWGPNYKIAEAYQRYKWYGFSEGIPQVTFNGLNNNFYGVKNYNEIKNRIEAQLNLTPIIELEASKSSNGYETIISGKVKNISNSTLTYLAVNGMTIKNRGTTGFHYNVTDIFEDEKEIINSISPGEEKNFSITVNGYNWDGQNLDGVIFVQLLTDSKKTILQSVFID